MARTAPRAKEGFDPALRGVVLEIGLVTMAGSKNPLPGRGREGVRGGPLRA
jgi:hypothetical protein